MVNKVFVGGRWRAKSAYKQVDKFIKKNRHLSKKQLYELIVLKLTTLIMRLIRKELEGQDTDYLRAAIERLEFYKDNLKKEIE